MIKRSTSTGESMRDRVRARAKKRSMMGGLDTLMLPEGVELYKPEKGTAEFDILPYRISVDNHPEVKKGELWYERTYLAHRNVGPEDKFLVCPHTIGQRCPICDEYKLLGKDPEADEDVVKALKPKERELFNIVLKDGDGSVMIMDISTYLFGDELERMINEGDEELGAFSDLQGGKTLKVRWDQKKMEGREFLLAGRIDFVDRDDIDSSALDVVVDLDKALKIMSYDEINEIFQSGGEEQPLVEDEKTSSIKEDEKPRRVIGRRVPATAEKEQAEEEDAEEEVKADKGGKPCIACDGTGKTSKGKTCPICDGSCVEESDEEIGSKGAEEEEEDEPASVAARAVPTRRILHR